MPERQDDHHHAAYRVGGAPPTAARGAAADARGPAAIFVAHGMGQQIPFETLEAVAEGLLANDFHGTGPRPAQVARTSVVGGERIQRLELTVTLADGSTREVHVYEGYWAPFTEGQVQLHDVAAFLFRSAIAGIRLGMREFRRWMFGRYERFPTPVRAVLYLLVALSVIVALTFLNGTVLLVALLRVPLMSPPAWLSDSLFQDVTTVLDTLLCAWTPLIIVLLWASWENARQERFRSIGVASTATFALALWSTLAAAVFVAAAFVFHAKPGVDRSASLFGTRLASIARTFDQRFELVVIGVAVIAVLIVVVRFAGTLIREIGLASEQRSATRALTQRVVAAFVVLIATIVAVAAAVWAARLRGSAASWRHGVAWPILVAVSLLVRWFLIEFAGDVAVYVQSQTLDRFFAVRQQIKDAVDRVAAAVYRDPRYQEVILVGHSLGSVVIYDVLNKLILDRQLGVHGAPEIVARTKLLLTFGSPLDKTAFIFATQGKGREPREALAASVQPLITDQAARPKWINVWSPWDIISGHLDYYDLPDKSNRNPVENMRDPRATTLLVAHVEYWNNPLLFQQILAHLI